MVVVSEDVRSSQRAIDLAGAEDGLWATVGIHPHNAARAGTAFEERLESLVRRPGVVAIGEIGLDYHYDRSPRDVQRDLFLRQLSLAAELDVPVVVHSRSAQEDTLSILEAWAGRRRLDGATVPLGVMHCFGYDVTAAERFHDLGFMISIPGTVTYPRADIVQAVARAVPDDALVIETDAPVLAPQVHRGKRNEPAYLLETAAAVSALRGVRLEEVAQQTSANAHCLFRISAAPSTTGAVGEKVSW